MDSKVNPRAAETGDVHLMPFIKSHYVTMVKSQTMYTMY